MPPESGRRVTANTKGKYKQFLIEVFHFDNQHYTPNWAIVATLRCFVVILLGLAGEYNCATYNSVTQRRCHKKAFAGYKNATDKNCL
jgi:hypothetical protein